MKAVGVFQCFEQMLDSFLQQGTREWKRTGEVVLQVNRGEARVVCVVWKKGSDAISARLLVVLGGSRGLLVFTFVNRYGI